MNVQITALLPMKGHSERVPGKNLRDFAGKPLGRWVLDTLARSPYIAEVLVDTDSPRIAEMVSSVPKTRAVDRPARLRGDMVPMNDILAHDLALAATGHFLQTHATNPLLTMAAVEAAIGAYFEGLGQYDSLFSVTARYARFYRPDGRPVNHNPEELLRTQDLEPLYEENSCLYLFSRESFLAAGGRRIGRRPRMYPISSLEAVDIDTEEDFALAEALMERIPKP